MSRPSVVVCAEMQTTSWRWLTPRGARCATWALIGSHPRIARLPPAGGQWRWAARTHRLLELCPKRVGDAPLCGRVGEAPRLARPSATRPPTAPQPRPRGRRVDSTSLVAAASELARAALASAASRARALDGAHSLDVALREGRRGTWRRAPPRATRRLQKRAERPLRRSRGSRIRPRATRSTPRDARRVRRVGAPPRAPRRAHSARRVELSS